MSTPFDHESAKNIENGVWTTLDHVHPNPWNPYKIKGRKRKSLERSLGKYSQIQELVVRPHPDLPGEYQIIDGESRSGVLKGRERVQVRVTVLHGLSDAEAKELTILLNQHGTPDQEQLARLVGALSDDQVDALPFNAERMRTFAAALSDDPDAPKVLAPQGVTIKAWVSHEALEVVNMAAETIRGQAEAGGVPISEDPVIAWGQILEYLAAELLGGSQYLPPDNAPVESP